MLLYLFSTPFEISSYPNNHTLVVVFEMWVVWNVQTVMMTSRMVSSDVFVGLMTIVENRLLPHGIDTVLRVSFVRTSTK